MCNCADRPTCQSVFICGRFAELSIIRPTRRGAQCQFYCRACHEEVIKASALPIRGMDAPQVADDDWHPSISTAIHLADMEMRRVDRLNKRSGE